jgi:hypothetical protein
MCGGSGIMGGGGMPWSLTKAFTTTSLGLRLLLLLLAQPSFFPY